ncbi:Rpn family recombination-promoting nuclease/putative transposase [Niabella terrae]
MKKTSTNGPRMGRYLNPLSDTGFKKIFGSEPNKDLLISFLNALFQGKKVVRDLVYNPQEQQASTKEHRTVIFDLTCTGEDGETFIIEMQRTGQTYFKDRAVFYATRPFNDQVQKVPAGWNYQLQEVYFIGIMDFKFQDSDPDAYIQEVMLINKKTCNVFYSKLCLLFIELPKFNLPEDQLKTELDGWLYLLRNLSEMKEKSVFLHKNVFQKLFRIAEIANLKKEEYMSYESELKAQRDYNAVMQSLKAEAEEKGMEKGSKSARIMIARQLLLQGRLSVAEIAAVVNEPETLISEMNERLNSKK